MEYTDPNRERRLRAIAHRQGLAVRKSRRPLQCVGGPFMLVDVRTNTIVAGDVNTGYGLTEDELEAALLEPTHDA